MTIPVITALYAAPLAVIFLFLSVRVILGRMSGNVSLGDGGQPDLVRRIRAQANFAEYVPLGLLLILLAELSGVSATWLHVTGAMLLVGRISHAWAMQGADRPLSRTVGILLTLTAVLLAAALAFPWHAIF